nr:MAG TPA: hypothetical protein [Caudoviricetes sp.]
MLPCYSSMLKIRGIYYSISVTFGNTSNSVTLG